MTDTLDPCGQDGNDAHPFDRVEILGTVPLVELVGYRDGGERRVRVLAWRFYEQVERHHERCNRPLPNPPEFGHCCIRAAVALLMD